MIQNKKLTNYVSDLDKFLNEFNEVHDLTASQAVEKAKGSRISRLRDKILPVLEVNKKIWDKF